MPVQEWSLDQQMGTLASQPTQSYIPVQLDPNNPFTTPGTQEYINSPWAQLPGGFNEWRAQQEAAIPAVATPTGTPVGYIPGLSQPNTAQTPGNFDMPTNLAPYSISGGTSGGTSSGINTSNNQAQNTSNASNMNVGGNQAQNTSNASNVNVGGNQAQNTANNFGFNTGQQGSFNTGTNQAQNTATNQGFNVGNQGSINTGTQGSSNSGVTNAVNQANNFSGLDTAQRNALMNAIAPQLTSAVANMPANYDAYTGNAVDSYQQMIQNAIQKQAPQLIGQLANRGILSSTQGNDILAKMLTDTATAGSTKGYEAAMHAALAKANMPTVLGQLAQLGQYSQGSSSGASSGINTGSSFGNTLGTSFGNTVGANTGVSQGTSLGNTLGTSFGNTLGVNGGNSQGTSSGFNLGQGNSNSQGTSSGFNFGQGESASQGTSSGNSLGLNNSNNFSNNSSFQTDPTVMYRSMADLIRSMM
jgi:hypothetical protein